MSLILTRALPWLPLQAYLEAETSAAMLWMKAGAPPLFTAPRLSYFPVSTALSLESPEVAFTLHFCSLLWIFWVMIFLQPDDIWLPSLANRRHHGLNLCLELLTVGESSSEWVILMRGPSAPSAIPMTTALVGIFSPFSHSENWSLGCLLWETQSKPPNSWTLKITRHNNYCSKLLKD